VKNPRGTPDFVAPRSDQDYAVSYLFAELSPGIDAENRVVRVRIGSS